MQQYYYQIQKRKDELLSGLTKVVERLGLLAVSGSSSLVWY